MPSSTTARPRGDTLPMGVTNMTFMVNKLGDDCAPLQFVRELTQNAIEAIQQLDDQVGEIRWDVDWNRYDLAEGPYKLCIIDTGAGMTGEEMVEYLNNLSSSIHEQSKSGNFGIGAKIAAAPKNLEGLIYLSWKEGAGYMVHLWFDPELQEYGLRRFSQNDGEFWTKVEDSVKPSPIKDHGTMVILLGDSSDSDTMEPPENTPMRSRWILRYLNTRFFKFPKGIAVKSREGWENLRSDSRHNFLREVHGQGPWLNENAKSKGQVRLDNATAHWWILKQSVDIDSGHNAGGGHVAALYQDEHYSMRAGRSGLTALQSFGVIFGCDRVVIYVEPDTGPDSGNIVSANTARTQLILNNEPLPWADWAAIFRENLPQDLEDYQNEMGARSDAPDYRKAIRDRLKQIRDLLRFSRFRPAARSETMIDPTDTTNGGKAANRGGKRTGGASSGGRGGSAGDIYALFAEQDGIPATEVGGAPEPQAKWISVKDNTRTPPDLDDRAAKFLPESNLILINKDFRVFTDMFDRWEQLYEHVPGARTVIERTAKEWFEQQLLEAVMSALALRRSGHWSYDEIKELWSEEALTTAILPRFHIDTSIKRNLGHRLGKLEAA